MSAHRPRKRFGQHFLRDHNVIDKVVAAIAPQLDDTVVEIGPGEGALTQLLIDSGCQLQVIELDRDLAKLLAQRWPSLQIINDDALNVDLEKLSSATAPTGIKLIGNLPYNVSTPILFHALEHLPSISMMVFMLQQEVVERMVAAPGTKAYGRLSVMLQYRCQLRKLFSVPPAAFEPPPQVNSAIVELTPKRSISPAADSPHALAKVVKAAFGQRRKTIANALKAMLSKTQISDAGIDPMARAEQLEVDEFVMLANRLEETI